MTIHIHNTNNLKRIKLTNLLTKEDKLIVRLGEVDNDKAITLCMHYRRYGRLTGNQIGLARTLLRENVL